MAQSRLTTALTEGHLTLPADGDIAVLRAPGEYDLSALPRDRVRLSHTFRPDHDAWAAAGWQVAAGAAAASAAVALVILPRSKALARGLVAQAAALAPLVLIDGQKTDGIDSMWHDLRAALGRDVASLTQAHGRLIWCEPGAALAGWALPGPQQGPDGLWTQAGVFSADGPDAGSVLLAAALPARLPARMADLGAGAGILSRAVLARDGVTHLDVVEAEAMALDCARLNLPDPRAAFVWADVTAHDPRAPWDGVVMNPPFHHGRAADPDLGLAFIAAARRGLSPQGQLWLVANRHLPYEAAMATAFRQVAEIGGNGRYKLIHASRPVQSARTPHHARMPVAADGPPGRDRVRSRRPSI